MANDKISWKTEWQIFKFKDEDGLVEKAIASGISPEAMARVQPERFIGKEIIDHNLAVNSGLNLVCQLIAGTGTSFISANAYIGVGDSSTAAAVGQTDLIAATNKLRKAMTSGTYPITGSSQQIVFQSTFGSADANYAWNEFAVFNAAAAGTMLNRVVDTTKGTKAVGETWTIQVTITFS